MGDLFLAKCPTVPTIGSSEVRFSTSTKKTVSLKRWPWLSYVGCKEIIPPQSRIQWGQSTSGARLDSTSALRIGSPGNNLTLAARSTNTSSDGKFSPVENQRVGIATITIDGRYRFKYWNDHAFWWWPMGDGGDKGDTTGLQFSYNLVNTGLHAGRDWVFSDITFTMRLATGIPDPKSVEPMGDGQIYTRVDFNAIDRGDLSLSTTLLNRASQKLQIGITINSGAVRNLVQSKVVHAHLGIPELPSTNHVEATIWLKLSDF